MAKDILTSLDRGNRVGLDKDDNLLLKGSKLIFNHIGTEQTLQAQAGALLLNGVSIGGGATGLLSVNIGAGTTNNYNPGGGFPAGMGRLDINPNVADSILTGLLAGSDNQSIRIRNTSATNNLTLAGQDTGSTAANRFSQGVVLPAGDSILAVYYAGTVNRWVL